MNVVVSVVLQETNQNSSIYTFLHHKGRTRELSTLSHTMHTAGNNKCLLFVPQELRMVLIAGVSPYQKNLVMSYLLIQKYFSGVHCRYLNNYVKAS